MLGSVCSRSRCTVEILQGGVIKEFLYLGRGCQSRKEQERKKGERKGKQGQEEWRKESLYLYIYQGKISNVQSK